MGRLNRLGLALMLTVIAYSVMDISSGREPSDIGTLFNIALVVCGFFLMIVKSKD